jgi:hypothetical protein
LERHKLTLPLQPAMPDLVLVAIGSACGVHGSRRHRCGRGRRWFSADPPLGEMGSAESRHRNTQSSSSTRASKAVGRPPPSLVRQPPSCRSRDGGSSAGERERERPACECERKGPAASRRGEGGELAEVHGGRDRPHHDRAWKLGWLHEQAHGRQ